jgi:hypothetical protein
MPYTFRSVLTEFGVWSANPVAFMVVISCAVAWLVFDRDSFDWHAVAVLATWTMTP